MADEEERVEEETEEEKGNWFEEHPKTVFWTRFVSWACFACVFPLIFLMWRFKIFQKVAKIHIGGVGLIVIIIIAVFAFTIIKYIKLALKARHTLLGQFLDGFCKIIIPLLTALIILYNVRDDIDALIQALSCVTICEAIAIPLNPLPKWAYEMQKNVKEEERKDTVDYVLDGFFKRKKEFESGEH